MPQWLLSISMLSEVADVFTRLGGRTILRAALPDKIRALLRWGWIYFLHFSGLLKWAQRRIVAQGGAVVLTLHRVLEPSERIESCSPPGMITPPLTSIRMHSSTVMGSSTTRLRGTTST